LAGAWRVKDGTGEGEERGRERDRGGITPHSN